MKRKKEEEIREKRERDARERRNTNLKKNAPKKKIRRKVESDSEEESESDEESEEVEEEVEPEPVQNKKKIFNYQENPLSKYRKAESDDDDDEEEDEESSPVVKKRTKKKMSKTVENHPKKKPSYKAKFNDFHKFRESDRVMSEDEDDESYESSEHEEITKVDTKKEANKSVEPKKNKKNSLYKRFNNYFFDENVINEEQLRNQKRKEDKENKNGNKSKEKKNVKKGFYHYQNNPKKEEKSIVDKKFELITRNTAGGRLNNIETVNGGHKGNKVKKMKEEKIKKKNFSKQNTNIYGEDKYIIESKLKRGRNNYNELDGRQNNSVAYHHDMNLSKNIESKNNAKQLKSDKNKKLANYKTQNLKKNVVQNLMTDFDQTMEEYSSLYGKHNATTTKGVKGYNDKAKTNLDSKSKMKSSKNKIKSDSKSRINGSVDQRQFKKNKTSDRNQLNSLKNDDYRTHSIDSRRMKSKNDKGSSNQESGNVLKRNKSLYDEVNPNELTLFRGQVDYNYAFVKNIDEKINELKNKYKKKGFTFKRKSNHEFIFIKGPYKHHVELMKLGNGLFYFNIKK